MKINDWFIFEQERKTCSNIYEILGHIAIFTPLVSCVFPWFSHLNYTGIKATPSIWTPEYFLSKEENITKIVEFFKSEENVDRFAKEVEKFYLEHEKALERAGIHGHHKNAYVMAIATLRSVANQELRKNIKIINNTSICAKTPWVTDITVQVNYKFSEIFKWYREQTIAWDIEGNLVKEIEWKIRDYFDKNVAKINWRFIYIDSRTPVLVEWCEVISLFRYDTLPNWELIRRTKIKHKDWNEKITYITKNNEIFRVEWREIISAYSPYYWKSDLLTIPKGTLISRINLENWEERYITKENKLFRIEFNGKQCELCDLHWYNNRREWREISIKYNWKELRVIVTKNWAETM